VVEHESIDPRRLPDECAISAVTLAELAAGPASTDDELERSLRLDRLLWALSLWDPIPLDGDAARAYGRVCAVVRGTIAKQRKRQSDLLIASTALAHDLPLYTRNPERFEGLSTLIHIVDVR
jgi:predicted nucleic acid-binding protein